MVLVVKEMFLVFYFLNFLNYDRRDFCWVYWPCVFLLLVRISDQDPVFWGVPPGARLQRAPRFRKSELAAGKTLGMPSKLGLGSFVLAAAKSGAKSCQQLRSCYTASSQRVCSDAARPWSLPFKFI